MGERWIAAQTPATAELASVARCFLQNAMETPFRAGEQRGDGNFRRSECWCWTLLHGGELRGKTRLCTHQLPRRTTSILRPIEPTFSAHCTIPARSAAKKGIGLGQGASSCHHVLGIAEDSPTSGND